MSAYEVNLVDLVKIYNKTVFALNGVSLKIQKGEFLALIGPSGCGKTTTLRTLAGFIVPDSGAVYVRGKDVTTTPPHKRQTALVFQNYALFPHMTIDDNIAFGLKMRKVSSNEIPRRVENVLEKVRLPGLGDRYPHQLSGGQQQRVALARALVIDPEVLLLDEPLSNLDAKLRIDMRLEIREIVKGIGATAVYVTHDQEEALSITDRIVVMDCGKVIQDGPPQEVYEAPKTYFTANFIGNANILEGTVLKANGERYSVKTARGVKMDARGWPDSHREGENAAVVIRHEHVRFHKSKSGKSQSGMIQGKIIAVAYVGAQTDYVILLDTGDQLKAIIPSGECDGGQGDRIHVTWDPNRIRVVTN